MKYIDLHSWIEMEEPNVGIVGVAKDIPQELGEIVYVDLPAVGKQVNAKEEIVVLEATKAAADVSSPVSGIVIAINERLKLEPELVNQSAEKEGWLFKIKLSHPEEVDLLMSEEAYQAKLKGV